MILTLCNRVLYYHYIINDIVNYQYTKLFINITINCYYEDTVLLLDVFKDKKEEEN